MYVNSGMSQEKRIKRCASGRLVHASHGRVFNVFTVIVDTSGAALQWQR